MTKTVYYTTTKDIKAALAVLSQVDLENDHSFDSVVYTLPKKYCDIIMIHSYLYSPEGWSSEMFFESFKNDNLVELPNGKEYVGSI